MKKIILFFLLSTAALTAKAQEGPQQPDQNRIEDLEQRTQKLEERSKRWDKVASKFENFKFSGYIQTQFQWGEEAASLKVGSSNEDSEDSFNRLGIRRGRVKLTYEEGLFSTVFQLDITEKKVGFKDAYFNVKDPWFNSMMLRAGIFDRPFGYEISYSSSRRESPERSTVFQTLFPDERDLGAMLVLQAPSSSPWSILKLETGLFAGNGIQQDSDSKKDFIGHLAAGKSFKSGISFGAGFSYYNGKVYQGTEDIYKMSGSAFELDSSEGNIGRYAKREYFGFDAQFSFKSAIGSTKLHAEYLFGQQPGLKGSSKSPNSSSRPEEDTYIRDFQGGYAMLVQSLGKLPVSAIAKFDWYDPNTDVDKDEIGPDSGTGKADVKQNTWGFGAMWDITKAFRLTAFYEINKNEKCKNLEGYEKDLKNDVFTFRLQYKF